MTTSTELEEFKALCKVIPSSLEQTELMFQSIENFAYEHPEEYRKVMKEMARKIEQSPEWKKLKKILRSYY